MRALRRDGTRWVLDAGPEGLTADAVAIATNAYTGDLFPGLRDSIIPMRGHGFVTEPLSDNVRRSILPQGQSLTDTRHLFSAVRMLPDGRLHVSAHGPAFGPEHPADWRRVDARARRLFPQLGKLTWSQGWSGFVAMTPEHFPRLHELAPGLFAGLGYNGRGIAAATMMGRDLATLVRGATGAATVFPLVPLRPLPWHRAAPALVRALVQVYRLHDLLDELCLPRSAAAQMPPPRCRATVQVPCKRSSIGGQCGQVPAQSGVREHPPRHFQDADGHESAAAHSFQCEDIRGEEVRPMAEILAGGSNLPAAVTCEPDGNADKP